MLMLRNSINKKEQKNQERSRVELYLLADKKEEVNSNSNKREVSNRYKKRKDQKIDSTESDNHKTKKTSSNLDNSNKSGK
jgi:hypothetical protein